MKAVRGHNGLLEAPIHKALLDQSEMPDQLAGGLLKHQAGRNNDHPPATEQGNMKIDELIGKPTLPPVTAVRKNAQPEQVFSDLLAERLRTSTTGPTGQVAEAQGAAPTPWAPTGATVDPAAAERVACDIETALNQWADIGELVAAPDGSSKEIQSRIEALMDSSRTLQKNLEALPDEHPLRRLADELSVFSSVESTKWQRGDYV